MMNIYNKFRIVALGSMLVTLLSAGVEGPEAVASWEFDEGAGVFFNDSTSNNNDGGVPGGIKWVPAIKGYGMFLESGKEEGSPVGLVDNSSTLNPRHITIEALVRPDSVNNDMHIVSHMANGEQGYRLILLNGNRVGWQLPSAGEPYTNLLRSSSAIAVGEWVYIAATYDGTVMRLYLNGVAAGELVRPGGIISSDSPIYIGGFSRYSKKNFFNGVLDEIRIYPEALSPNVIRQTADLYKGLIAHSPRGQKAGPIAVLPKAIEHGSIKINAKKSIGRVNRLVFGNNVLGGDPGDIGAGSQPYVGRTGTGVWNPVAHAPRSDTLALAKNIGISAMRYPGGCFAHGFDWKKTIGPLERRPEFPFGLDEYISYCRALGAEPVITVSDYTGSPQDAADLVEYLNAPNSPQYPWAQKRAANGNVEPYGVKYFEMGNESYHGNHLRDDNWKCFTASEYAAWFIEISERIRKIDPNVQIGIVTKDHLSTDDSWNKIILTRAGSRADFAVVHYYGIQQWGGDPAMTTPADRMMRAAMSDTANLELMLKHYNAMILEYSGRALPIALTEYNAGYKQDKPVPYRFSYGVGLMCADFIRVLLNPENNILMANYWHFIHSYWGMVRAPGATSESWGAITNGQPVPWLKMPAYYTYQLWGQHFQGDEIVETIVDSPVEDFEGLSAAWIRGDVQVPDSVDSPKIEFKGGAGENSFWVEDGAGEVVLNLTNFTGESYPVFGKVKVTGGIPYKLVFDVEYSGERLPRVGVGVVDSRGWDFTRTAAAIEGVESIEGKGEMGGVVATAWDTKSMDLCFRLIRGTGKSITATIKLSNFRMKRIPNKEPYETLTAISSFSEVDGKVYLVVFNKESVNDIKAPVSVSGVSVSAVRYWQVNAPSLDSFNLVEEKAREVVSGASVSGITPSGFQFTFPAHSMTAFEINTDNANAF